MRISSKLQKLYLGTNNIGDEGASALASALKTNSALQQLQLDSNCIRDKGAMALAEAFKLNSTLQELKLTVNRITPLLNDQIQSLLSKENRDKRRLELENPSWVTIRHQRSE
jgi:Ran GTPase-activating protein (RanGAP) involved in mRNA processing and transport